MTLAEQWMWMFTQPGISTEAHEEMLYEMRLQAKAVTDKDFDPEGYEILTFEDDSTLNTREAWAQIDKKNTL
jgi:hypothetical protein